MKPALQFRLHQQLTLTPQLQQAIRLLQLSQLELEAELRQIAESNPLLEFADEIEDDEAEDTSAMESDYQVADKAASSDGDEAAMDWADGGGAAESPIDFSSNSGSLSSSSARGDDEFEPQNAAPETLQQHLTWQLNLASFNPREHLIASVLIDALSPAGYLAEGMDAILAALPSDLNASLDEVEAVRRQLQGFDPAGVGSIDLRDCLRVQLQQFDPDTPHRDLALRIVDEELELLARNDIAKLARRLHATTDDVAEAAVLIRSLDPRPGAALDTTPVEYVAPDAYAIRDGSRWRVSLNPDSQPRLGLNQHYCG
ncbi:MAG: RNA polymerase factor sigma-54, partial [Rhodanobacter sp.]